MEDDFFLPFLYERLRDRFSDLVSKKPERFGGNVDILFGEIPIELKVRKGHRDALAWTRSWTRSTDRPVRRLRMLR